MVLFDPSVSKASGGPREGKELCKRSTSLRDRKTDWNWQFIRLKFKPAWRASLPALQGCTGPVGGVQGIIWPHQLVHFTDKVSHGGAELQAKCLGCQGGQGKFQPTLFCLQAQTFHYTTHSAKFKHVRVWWVLCLLASKKKKKINDGLFQLQKPPSFAMWLTWFDISSASPNLYHAVSVGPHSSPKLTHVSDYRQPPCGCDNSN